MRSIVLTRNVAFGGSSTSGDNAHPLLKRIADGVYLEVRDITVAELLSSDPGLSHLLLNAGLDLSEEAPHAHVLIAIRDNQGLYQASATQRDASLIMQTVRRINDSLMALHSSTTDVKPDSTEKTSANALDATAAVELAGGGLAVTVDNISGGKTCLISGHAVFSRTSGAALAFSSTPTASASLYKLSSREVKAVVGVIPASVYRKLVEDEPKAGSVAAVFQEAVKDLDYFVQVRKRL